MTTVKDFHPQAMDLADEAFRFQRKGAHGLAVEYFLRALELEQQAAMLLPPTQDTEPSRSILFRSAAQLAYNAEQYARAEKLIAHGLIGYPPPEIEEELKNLYENINFMRHLAHRGISLSKNQWLMSLEGNATSFGGTLVEPLVHRVENITKLFYRTVERLLGLDYRLSSGPKREIRNNYNLFVNAFVPSSFAVAFQIGAPTSQQLLFDTEPKRPIAADSIIDEVMRCFEILEQEKPEDLKAHIRSETYYDNFIGLAKQIAPDGNDITMVGFNSIHGSKERPLTLRKNREQLRNFHVTSVPESTAKETLRGILTYASSPRGRKYGRVKLFRPDYSKAQEILVPIAIMKDVVQPYFEENVSIVAYTKGKDYVLDEITKDILPESE